jgi:hypothetical protein
MHKRSCRSQIVSFILFQKRKMELRSRSRQTSGLPTFPEFWRIRLQTSEAPRSN